ncbi:MAG TPA: 50S ribosomal protein L25/general stress protein Ctc [Nocardioidaceae bacterium]|nr:50S ribosomal protein L25/general stress protein Ctc [Nocardioidaceae bacterium]
MSEVKIQAESRTEFGKGAARRIRRADKVPAVLYGHGTDPIHITLPGHDIMLALKNSNALLTIDVEGSSQLALPKQVQRDPIKGFIEHVDLLVVKKGEKVTVNVPIIVVGEPGPDALVVTEHSYLSLEAEATHIPESVELDITGAEVGTQFHARDLKLPSGSLLQDDEDLMIVNVTNAPTAEQLDEELAEAEAEVGIEKAEHEEGIGGEAVETGDAEAAAAAEESDNA